MEIKDYPNYLIYPDGRLLNKKRNKFLKPTPNPEGYLIVKLYEGKNIHKSFTIHRLVANHYIPNPENKPEIDHINRTPSDNRVENLRWATRIENCGNKGLQKNKKVPFKYITIEGRGYRFTRSGCKRKYSSNLSKLICYSFFYQLKVGRVPT